MTEPTKRKPPPNFHAKWQEECTAHEVTKQSLDKTWQDLLAANYELESQRRLIAGLNATVSSNAALLALTQQLAHVRDVMLREFRRPWWKRNRAVIAVETSEERDLLSRITARQSLPSTPMPSGKIAGLRTSTGGNTENPFR